MSSLNFETGIKTFDINGDQSKTVSFCPTDFNFIKRLYDAFVSVDALQEKYKAKISAELSPDEMMEIIVATDGDVRSIIDTTFEAPVSDIVLGKLSAFAIAGGVPIWAGFLLAVMAECDEGFSTETTEINPKLQKVLGKYKK